MRFEIVYVESNFVNMKTNITLYDVSSKDEYDQKWMQPYGRLELANKGGRALIRVR